MAHFFTPPAPFQPIGLISAFSCKMTPSEASKAPVKRYLLPESAHDLAYRYHDRSNELNHWFHRRATYWSPHIHFYPLHCTLFWSAKVKLLLRYSPVMQPPLGPFPRLLSTAFELSFRIDNLVLFSLGREKYSLTSLWVYLAPTSNLHSAFTWYDPHCRPSQSTVASLLQDIDIISPMLEVLIISGRIFLPLPLFAVRFN